MLDSNITTMFNQERHQTRNIQQKSRKKYENQVEQNVEERRRAPKWEENAAWKHFKLGQTQTSLKGATKKE